MSCMNATSGEKSAIWRSVIACSAALRNAAPTRVGPGVPTALAVRPKLTVITPSFNQASSLEATIRSVLDQGYEELEYFVVDGGSTDGSAEIVERYADRLSWWTSERDRGQTDALNKGLRRAT